MTEPALRKLKEQRQGTPRSLGTPLHQFQAWFSWLYRWEFKKGRKSLSVAVNGPLIVDDLAFVVRAALDGAGFAFVAEQEVEAYLKEGSLVRVLKDWYQPYAGFFLYYPSRRQQTSALNALISVLRI